MIQTKALKKKKQLACLLWNGTQFFVGLFLCRGGVGRGGAGLS
jgi:hypothetical protein